MKNLIVCIYMFIPASVLLAQDKHNLSVEFNVNRANYKMESLNSYLNDTNFLSPFLYGTDQRKNIKNGMDYSFILSYQPLNFMDFGVFANFQSASVELPYGFIFEELPSPYVVEGTDNFEISAIATGISTNLHVNKLLHLDQRKTPIINKLQLSLGLMGGLGFSNFIIQHYAYVVGNPNNNSKVDRIRYEATDFQGRSELKVGYRFGKKLFFDAGFKIGYQFFKTSVPKNYSGSDFYLGSQNNERTVHLDFSGTYYGIYLKIGK